MKHYAYNSLTGEIVANNRGNALKRAVKCTEQSNRKHWDTRGKWIFSHSGVRGIDAKMGIGKSW